MERLVIVLVKLLFQLAWVLFKFAVRLVLFAWTGDWRKLDKVEAQLREALEQARQGTKPAPRPAAVRAKAKSKRAPRGKKAEQGPWPFEFAPELTDQEPSEERQGGETLGGGELVGGEAAIPPRSKRAPARKRRVPPPLPELPLALAVRDPRMVRDAMVLTAVLGPRGRRDRRF